MFEPDDYNMGDDGDIYPEGFEPDMDDVNELEMMDEDDDFVEDGDDDESDPLASESEPDGDAEYEELFGVSVNTLLAEKRGSSKKRRNRYRGSGSKRRVSEVPRQLTALMGSATIAYMARRFEDAERSLLRVIQEAPRAVAPHRTLALISEERGDLKKALEHLMFAAHLDRQDRDLWKRCAALSHELKDDDQAIYCLTMALKGTHGRDAEALQARAYLLKTAGMYRKAADSYVKLFKLRMGDLETVLTLAEMFEISQAPEKAEPFLREAIEYAEKHPPRLSNRDDIQAYDAQMAKVVQTLVQIWFSLGRYEDAAGLLTQVQDRRSLGDLQIPFVQRVMLAICQYRSGSRALASVMFNEFFMSKDAIIKDPKLVWQVADACQEAGDFAKTLKAYNALLALDEYKEDIGLLLKRSEVLEDLGRMDEADDDLRKILDICPGHVEATIRLAHNDSSSDVDPWESSDHEAAHGVPTTSRKKRHRISSIVPSSGEADLNGGGTSGIATKKQRGSSSTAVAQGMHILLEQSFREGGAKLYLCKVGPYLEAALHLEAQSLSPRVADDCTNILEPIAVSQSPKSIGQALLRLLTDEKVIELIERVVEGIYATSGMPEGNNSCRDSVDVLLSVARSRARSNQSLVRRVHYLALFTHFARGDIPAAFEDIRSISKDWPSDSRVWLICSKLDVFCGDRDDDGRFRIRIFRFLARQMRRRECVGPPVFMASAVIASRSVAGSYKPALRLHGRVFRGTPGSALSALCIGTNLLYLSQSRTVSDRNEVALKAFAYLDMYRRLRREQFANESQIVRDFIGLEIDYNIARAMHDLGIVYMAADLYMKILERRLSTSCSDEGVSQDIFIPTWLNIKRDAAHNLVRILGRSGAVRLAIAVMHEHLRF